MSIGICIVDDKAQNRISLSEQIRYSADIEILFSAKNGNDFLAQIKFQPKGKLPDVVLMDIEMPDMNGIEAVSRAHALYPEIKFLMFTVFDDDDKIFDAIQAGANGYLLKDEKVANIIEYIQQVVELGGAPMSPRIARKTLALLSRSNKPAAATMDATTDNTSLSELSEREIEVLKLVVDGYDYRGIAERIYLSTHTVRKHIANIYKKLHISSKAQAIKLANKTGLV
jgi:DNA-binding NarL/FixJ family response regulator